MMALCYAATGFGLIWLALILFTLFFNGLAGLNLAVFTQMTPPPGSAGGLLNAIAGSLVMTIPRGRDRDAHRHAGRHLYG